MQGIIMWLVLLVGLLVIEGMTAQLTTVWFAVGALAAAIACWQDASLTVQLVIFIGVSVVLFIFTRPLALKYAKKDLETNVNSLPGRTAVVTEKIDNLAQTGKVRINDVDWLARSTGDSIIIEEGKVVEITEVQGVKLIVKELHKKEETQ